MDSRNRSAPACTTVRDVVRDVVGQVASEEMALVASLSQASGSDAVRRLARKNRKREPLGFGLGEIVVLATPIVWIAVEDVVHRVLDSAADSTASG